MQYNSALLRSVIYGGLFVIVTAIFVVIYTLFDFVRWSSESQTYVTSATEYGVAIVIIALSALLLFLTMRGYVYLGEKYAAKQLALVAKIYCALLLVMYSIYLVLSIPMNLKISNLPVFQSLDIVATYGFFIYTIVVLVLSWNIWKLHPRLTTATYPVYVIGIWAVYWLYLEISYSLQISPLHFLGYWLYLPVPEAFLVVASMLLFFEASKR